MPVEHKIRGPKKKIILVSDEVPEREVAKTGVCKDCRYRERDGYCPICLRHVKRKDIQCIDLKRRRT